MALASTSVLVVGQGPKIIEASVYVSRIYPSCRFVSIGGPQRAAYESVFLSNYCFCHGSQSMWDICGAPFKGGVSIYQSPLALMKVSTTGLQSFLGACLHGVRPPGLESSSGAQALTLWVVSYNPGSPTQGYSSWTYHIFSSYLSWYSSFFISLVVEYIFYSSCGLSHQQLLWILL